MYASDAGGNGRVENLSRQERAQTQSVGLLTGTDNGGRNEIHLNDVSDAVIRFGKRRMDQ